MSDDTPWGSGRGVKAKRLRQDETSKYGGELRYRRLEIDAQDWTCEVSGLDTLRRGVLLTIFLLYFREGVAVKPDTLQTVTRLRKRVVEESLSWLESARVIKVTPEGVVPDGAFGLARDAATRGRQSSRHMPDDWAERRQAVFARDRFACVYCGRETDDPHCDHVVPVISGGSHEMDNLVTSCRECNLSKWAKPLAQWLPDRKSPN